MGVGEARGRADVHVADPFDCEPGGLDRAQRVSRAVAAANESRPDPPPVEALLDSRLAGTVGAHMLHETQLGARLKHASQLSQRAGRIRNRAKHQADHRSVEARGRERKRRRGRVPDPDSNRGVLRGLLGPGTKVGLRLKCHNLVNRSRVARKVQSVAGADLNHPTRKPGEQLVAMLTDLTFHKAAEPLVDAGEDGMPDR